MALGPEIFINQEGLLKERGSNIWPSPHLGLDSFINSDGLLIERGLVKRGSAVYLSRTKILDTIKI